VRAYSAAIAAAATQKLLNIRNTATNETCDIIVATNGGFGNVANCSGVSSGLTVAVFCALSAGSCAVTERYDQVSTINLTQATAAAQPTLNQSCMGSKPCMQFAGASSQTLAGTSLPAQAQPWTVMTVAERTANFTSGQTIWGTSGSFEPRIIFNVSANQFAAYAGSGPVAATALDSAPHAFSVVFNATTSAIAVDGSVTSSVSLGADTLNSRGSTSQLGTSNSNGTFFSGFLSEDGIAGSGFSPTDQQSLCHQQYLYYGSSFTTSC
ncbi:MAG: hypothetical protein ACYDH4_12605, partial [Candidatus Cryosericum sp.]